MGGRGRGGGAYVAAYLLVCNIITHSFMSRSIDPIVSVFQGEGASGKRAMSKKDLLEREKERKKKKKARWMDKVKDIEESREKEKNKWQSFNHKAIVKSKKGEGRRRVGEGEGSGAED